MHFSQHNLCTRKTEVALETKFDLDFHRVYMAMATNSDQRSDVKHVFPRCLWMAHSAHLSIDQGVLPGPVEVPGVGQFHHELRHIDSIHLGQGGVLRRVEENLEGGQESFLHNFLIAPASTSGSCQTCDLSSSTSPLQPWLVSVNHVTPHVIVQTTVLNFWTGVCHFNTWTRYKRGEQEWFGNGLARWGQKNCMWLTFNSREWSRSNFSCSLTSNITWQGMKNLAFHSLLRRKTIVLLNSHSITYTFLCERLGECTFWTWVWKDKFWRRKVPAPEEKFGKVSTEPRIRLISAL